MSIGGGAPGAAGFLSGGGTFESPNWVRQASTTSPTGVTFGTAAYDPVRDQVVEFGGATASAIINQTWVWASQTQTWVQLSPATSPPARAEAAMAWDPALNEIVLFGGQNASGTPLNDLWAWNGTTWSALTATGTAPAARYGAAMAWDPSRSGLVVFGGNSGSALFNDTFKYGSGAWSTIQTNGAAGAPVKRQLPAMAYSTSTSQMLLFGGINTAATTLGDTWVLGSSSWTAQSPTASPPARYAAGAVYDPGLGGVVLFGGFHQEDVSTYDDTWIWDGATWLSAGAIATPGARYGFSMAATDAGQLIMFGGAAGGSPSTQTWLYDTNVPVLGVTFSDANGNPATAFETGDSLTVNVSAENVGVNAIVPTTITSTLSDNFLALGSLINWAGTLLGPCDASPTVCGAILGLSVTLSKISLLHGAVVWGSYEGTLVGSLIGCTILTIPATAANLFGSSAVASAPLTTCGGGLGDEDWWSYSSTDIGHGATAQVNVANGNLVVKQQDSTPITSHGQLGFELGRAYNSQNDMVTPSALGVGWQFDVGRTGPSGVGGFQLATLLVPTLQSAAQPLSVTYIDGDGTRHVFSLNALSLSVGPINLNDLANQAISKLLKLLDPNSLPYALSSPTYNLLCLDATYTGPPGLDEYLFRYVGVLTNTCDGGATSSPSAVTVGWSVVRPDRVRYDFDYRGQLLDALDGAGNKMVYKFDNVDRLVDVHSAACTPDSTAGTNPVKGPACPGYTLSYSDFIRNGTNLYRVDVSDPAGRITSYIATRGFEPQLIEVWDPGNPFTTVGPAVPSQSYTYSTATTACPGSAAGVVTVGQMCSATDADGNTTTFAYTPSPVGPDRVLSIIDRRGNAAGGSSTGAETRFTYHIDGANPYVTADTAAPATFGSGSGCDNNASCHRTRYASIDTAGRVGEIDDGNATDAYLHQQAFFWDGDAIASCNQPGAVVDNNLCETITRAVPSNAPFTPDSVGTGTINGVTVNDQATKYVYGDMGQLLKQTVLVDPSAGWSDANSDISTYGDHVQYFETNNNDPVHVYDDYLTGSGGITSTSPASGAAYAAAVNLDNPTGYYRFRETSGSTLQSDTGSHNGTYTGGVVLAQPGRVDKAIEEMGGTYAASVTSPGFASGTGSGSAFSIESWVKTTSTAPEYQTVVGATANTYAAVGRFSGGLPAVYLASDVAGHHVLSVVGSQSIADGQWHQLDVTYDGTGTAAGVIFYVDGHTIPQTVYSDTLNGAFAAAGAPMAIADTTGVAGADPNSLIDELSYFPTALSATKIQNHYAAATGNTRVDGRTLYAVVDRTETLTPRGNTTAASSHWGDYLTVYRRDVPASSTSPSAYPRPNQTAAATVCGTAAGGNTGLLCETDTPSSDGVPAGVCQSLAAGLPNTPPTSSGYPHTCSTSSYDGFGEKTTQTSPKVNAGFNAQPTRYDYYADTGTCSGSGRNNCDLSGNVSLGGMLEAVTDPAGYKVTFAYDRAGNPARSWSRNATAALGNVDLLAQSWTTPASPPSPDYAEVEHGNPVTSALLSLSPNDAEVVAPDGTVSGSGANAAGQLGTNTTTSSTVPVSAAGVHDVVEIAQTSTATCPRTIARTGSGAVYQWGNGTTTPNRVTGLPAVIAIAAGGCHLLALDATGNVWAWGSNSAGQLGDGTTTDRTTPVQVLSGVAAIAAGGQHSLAVKTDGTVRAWGANTHGQLGDGTTSNHSNPTPVSNLTRVRAVSAGSDTSYAIRADGTAWAWGDNSTGELGTGSGAGQATSPTQISAFGPSTAAVRQIVGSDHGAAALMLDGTVRAWGDNSHGQLAGATGAGGSNTPLTVPGLTKQIALAGNAAAYLTGNGAGQTTIWGLVTQGQVGDSSTPGSPVTPETAAHSVSPFAAPWRYTEGARDPVGNLTLTTTDPEGRVLATRPARG
ncbi:MAG: hypothetical protein QOI25_3084, partial [Mycobacterium sp.]|nr:hypothetical protein [Mycobacterium sp.]